MLQFPAYGHSYSLLQHSTLHHERRKLAPQKYLAAGRKRIYKSKLLGIPDTSSPCVDNELLTAVNFTELEMIS